MKKIITLIITLMLLAGSQWCYAQFSVGIAGTASKYFGSKARYPLESANQFPALLGGKIRGSYGFLKQNSINLSIGYGMTTQKLDFNYWGNTLDKSSSLEMEVSYHRYLVGDYNDANLNVYGMAGLSGTLTRLNFTIPNKEAMDKTGETKLFKDRSIMGVFANLGIGTEARLGSVYVFLEGKVSLHTNAYVDNTTIWDTNLMYFGSGTFGVRVPILRKIRPST